MVEQPSGTVTLVFTDIEGSTRLLRELGRDAYLEALAAHRRIVREACARQGGYEVDYEGDSFFYAFPSAGEGLTAVEEAMRELERGPIRLRVGIHTGEPGLDPPKYVGMDVHRAARICSAAHGGQVLVSERAHEELLGGDFEFRDVGLHKLKDLAESEKLFQFGGGEFPPLRSLNATNLPAQRTRLIGRELELAELLLLVRERRLLSLIGAGGSGKTRLAIQVAAELVEEFKDGVFWVSLSTLHNPEFVLPTISEALGAKAGLEEHLAQRRSLLLVDNFEHLLDAAVQLSALLERCPNVHLLVTSRAPLRVAGEYEYPVEPLSETDALLLFRERAVVSEPEDAVLQICRRLDQLPLAIELAAARTRILPPEKLLARLERRLPLLSSARRDAPARQRTLRATIEWSHDLLDPDQQQLFARLAVFAGSFTLEAGEAVCAAELSELESLVEQSLVRRCANGRLELLTTIREFARDQLDATGEADTFHFRHARYFLEGAESYVDASLEEERTGWLEAENENAISALTWLVDTGQVELALRLGSAVVVWWAMQGGASVGGSLLERAVEGSAEATPIVRAKAMYELGAFFLASADLGRSRDLLEQSKSLYEELGDRHALGKCLSMLGLSAAICGDFARALELCEAAKEIADEVGDVDLKGMACNSLGLVARSCDDLKAATARFTEAASCWRECGNDNGVSGVLMNLAAIALTRGDFEEAEAKAEEALAIASRVLHRVHCACATGLLGWVALTRGEGERARKLLRNSLTELAEIADVRESLEVLEGLAVLEAREGDVRKATRLFAAAGEAREKLGLDTPPDFRSLIEDGIATCRESLGASFEALRGDGAALPIDRAIEFALETASNEGPMSIASSSIASST